MCFGALLLILFLWTSDWEEMLSKILEAKYQYVAPGLAIYFIGVWIRSIRWRYLLLPVIDIPHTKLFPVVVVGYMANNILPFRMGEFVRSYYLSLKLKVSPSTGLSTILVERILDSLTLLVLVGYASLSLPFSNALNYFSEALKIHHNILISVIVLPFLLLFLLLIVIALSRRKMEYFLMLVTNPFPTKVKNKVTKVTKNALDGLTSLNDWKTIIRILVLSIPVWLCEATLFHFVSLSLGLHNVFPNMYVAFMASLFVTGVSNIGSSIPAAPGGIGLFEWIARETLILISNFGVSRAEASAYATITHISLLLPMVILGQVFLWLGSIKLPIAVNRKESLSE